MSKIGLKETLAALRKELSESILDAEGKDIRFEVGEIELEVQFVVEDCRNANGGVKFWVVEMGGGISEKNAMIQRLKIPLKPLKNNQPIQTSSDDIPDG